MAGLEAAEEEEGFKGEEKGEAGLRDCGGGVCPKACSRGFGKPALALPLGLRRDPGEEKPWTGR